MGRLRTRPWCRKPPSERRYDTVAVQSHICNMRSQICRDGLRFLTWHCAQYGDRPLFMHRAEEESEATLTPHLREKGPVPQSSR